MRASTPAPARNVLVQLPFGVSVGAGDLGVRVPGHGVPDAAEAVGARRLQRLQHRLDALAQVQVRVADNRGGGRAGP